MVQNAAAAASYGVDHPRDSLTHCRRIIRTLVEEQTE